MEELSCLPRLDKLAVGLQLGPHPTCHKRKRKKRSVGEWVRLNELGKLCRRSLSPTFTAAGTGDGSVHTCIIRIRRCYSFDLYNIAYLPVYTYLGESQLMS